jgi:hypothetical protein
MIQDFLKDWEFSNDMIPDQCERMNGKVCPLGWEAGQAENMGGSGTGSSSNGNNFCVAPPWYDGKCGNKMDLRPLTSAMRQAVAGHCGLSFPCKDEIITPSFQPQPPAAEVANAQHVVEEALKKAKAQAKQM